MEHRETELMTRLINLLEERKRDCQPIPWEAWMHDFLRDLERHRGLVSAAIDLNAKSRDTIYKARRRNEEFARRWDSVIEDAAREKAAASAPGNRRSRMACAD